MTRQETRGNARGKLIPRVAFLKVVVTSVQKKKMEKEKKSVHTQSSGHGRKDH